MAYFTNYILAQNHMNFTYLSQYTTHRLDQVHYLGNLSNL